MLGHVPNSVQKEKDKKKIFSTQVTQERNLLKVIFSEKSIIVDLKNPNCPPLNINWRLPKHYADIGNKLTM